MIKSTIKQELKNMTYDQLRGKVEELRRELFKIRLNATTSHIKSFPTDQKQLKKNIACALTFLKQKEGDLHGGKQ